MNIYLSILPHPSIYLTTSIYLSHHIYSSIYLTTSIHLSYHIYSSISLHLFIYLTTSIHLSHHIYSSILPHLFIYLTTSIHLSYHIYSSISQDKLQHLHGEWSKDEVDHWAFSPTAVSPSAVELSSKYPLTHSCCLSVFHHR